MIRLDATHNTQSIQNFFNKIVNNWKTIKKKIIIFIFWVKYKNLSMIIVNQSIFNVRINNFRLDATLNTQYEIYVNKIQKKLKTNCYFTIS